MLPKGFSTLVIADHVGFQVCHQAALAIVIKDLGNVRVGARRITVFLIRTITVVGPVWMTKKKKGERMNCQPLLIEYMFAKEPMHKMIILIYGRRITKTVYKNELSKTHQRP